MRLPQFNSLLVSASDRHVLKNCSVVIDGHNYFYSMYEKSNLSSHAGSESDKFAEFLRSQLVVFQEANIKCYFIFKGGSRDVQRRLTKNVNISMSQRDKTKTATIFVKTICRQVLEDMGFDYVISQNEAKEQCVALASELHCPVVSNDVELGILSDSYINYHTMKFDPHERVIQCKLLSFTKFLKKHQLSIVKFSIFLLLAMDDIFPERYFAIFLQKIHAPYSRPHLYEHIFKWLSTRPEEKAIEEILKEFEPNEKESILQKEKEIRAILTRKPMGIPCQYFLDKNSISITDIDPQWFEKGIALRYISIPFIYLYKDCYVDGSWAFEKDMFPDAILLSTDIIKYALNLLHNYRKKSFKIYRYNGKKIEINTTMPDVPKPNYTVNNVVFENGWSDIQRLNLFNHFLSFTMRGIDLAPLEGLPQDARLLMIALAYMTYKSDAWGQREALSVLLSYAALSTDGGAHLNSNIENIVEDHLVYPLFQFQHCLELLNDLNALCGYTYNRTDYSKTYNGKLVYNVLIELYDTDTDALEWILNKLTPAPNALTLFKNLVATHEVIIPFNN